MRAKITGELMASLKGPFEVWDEKLQGLSARRQTDKGRVTYRFRYVNAEGRKVNVVVGDAANFKTPDEARKEAKLIAGQAESARRGAAPDPAAERDAARVMPTVEEVWADYETHVLSKKRGRTPDTYRGNWLTHIKPRIGAKRIDLLTSSDIEAMHLAITNQAKEAPPPAPPAAEPFRKRGGPSIALYAARYVRTLQRNALAASAPEMPLSAAWADFEATTLGGYSKLVQARYRHMWSCHIAPRFAEMAASAISEDAIEAMRKEVAEMQSEPPVPQPKAIWRKRGGPVVANRCRDLASAICARAIFKGHIAKNPCVGVEENAETPKGIRFSNPELALILASLEAETEDVQIAFGLFLETPVRHNNIAGAEIPEFIDLLGEAPVWRIPGEKLKGGEPYEAHISCALGRRIHAYIEKMRSVSPRYLFPRVERELRGRDVARAIDPTKPRLKFQSAWERIQERALELAGERAGDYRALAVGTPHTFKHTFLSSLSEMPGVTPFDVQKAGDHADIRTSMDYIHSARGRLRELVQGVHAKLPTAA